MPLFNNGNNLCLSVVMVVVKTTLGQAGKSKPALEENRQGVCISREVDRAESQFCANDADEYFSCKQHRHVNMGLVFSCTAGSSTCDIRGTGRTYAEKLWIPCVCIIMIYRRAFGFICCSVYVSNADFQLSMSVWFERISEVRGECLSFHPKS